MQQSKTSEDAKPRPRFVDAVRRWLQDARVTGEMLAVLVALSDHTDAAGICWPSQGYLAHRLVWSRQRVGRVIAQLVALDLVRTRQLYRRDRGCSVLEYELVGVALDTTAPPRERSGQGGVTERDSRTEIQNEELCLSAQDAPGRAVIDEHWQPACQTAERAARARPAVDIAHVLDKFRAYHHGRAVLHPDRAFHLWVLREREERHDRPTPSARSRPAAGHATPGDASGPIDNALLRFRLRRGGALE